MQRPSAVQLQTCMDPPDSTPNGIANSAEVGTSRDFLKRSGMSFD